jgi:hypothetical protein
MICEIYLKGEKDNKSTNVLIDAVDEEKALAIFKRQRIHESGISKKDYIAKQKLYRAFK